MADCSSFEVAIEMQRREALGEAEAAALGDHLAGCPSCRSYEALVRRTESTMNAQTLDLNALDLRIAAEHRRFKSRRWVPLAVVLGIAVAWSAITGKPGLIFAALGGAGLVLFGIFQLRVVLEARRIAALSRSTEDLTRFYRRQLEGRIRRFRILLVVIPLCAVDAIAEWTLGVWPQSLRNLPALLVVLVPLVAALAVVLVLRARHLPAIRRELSELAGR